MSTQPPTKDSDKKGLKENQVSKDLGAEEAPAVAPKQPSIKDLIKARKATMKRRK